MEETLADGRIVKLEDGTVWRISGGDEVATSLWLPTDDIVVCDDKLIHVEDGEQVQATQVR